MLFLVLFAQGFVSYSNTSTAKKGVPKANNKTTSSAKTAIHVERDFDTIREFQSYDPATDGWSKVEEFDGVDILEDATEQRDTCYLYLSFWAYDIMQKCWKKVDIRNYGYRLGGETATQAEGDAPANKKSKNFTGFWKSWILGMRVGAGPTFFSNKINNLKVIETEQYFFLQPQGNGNNTESLEINWFSSSYKRVNDPLDGNSGALNVRYALDQNAHVVGSDNQSAFEGIGWNIPTTTLFMHYNFFKRIRLGAGCELAINQLKELKLREGASNISKLKIVPQWFYNMAWFGLLGFKIVHSPRQDLVLDLQIGKNYNLGSDLNTLFRRLRYIYEGWLFGGGVAYERKLNNYFRFLVRLGGDWKKHDDTPKEMSNTDASVILHQTVFHLDLGIQLGFGKDTEEDTVTHEEDED